MTSRPRRDMLDGTITDPDQARRVMVTLARKISKPVWATEDVERMAGLVLWMDAHLSTGGALPTQWAEDGTIPRKPVTDVPLPQCWQVTDNITGQPVRDGMTKENAEWLCRGLNLDFGGGGRYKAEPAR